MRLLSLSSRTVRWWWRELTERPPVSPVSHSLSSHLLLPLLHLYSQNLRNWNVFDTNAKIKKTRKVSECISCFPFSILSLLSARTFQDATKTYRISTTNRSVSRSATTRYHKKPNSVLTKVSLYLTIASQVLVWEENKNTQLIIATVRIHTLLLLLLISCFYSLILMTDLCLQTES